MAFRSINADNFDHPIGGILIFSHAHRNVNGLPFASPIGYTLSCDLPTMGEIFCGGPEK
jgi:hypothetical protein